MYGSERMMVLQAKQYLQELKRLDTCIHQRLREKQSLYDSTVGAVRTDKERVQASANADALPNLIARIETLEKEIDRQIDDYIQLKHRIINQIHGLSNDAYISVLHKRYVEFKRLEEIAVEMNYTYKYISRMHGYALQEFQRVYADQMELGEQRRF